MYKPRQLNIAVRCVGQVIMSGVCLALIGMASGSVNSAAYLTYTNLYVSPSGTDQNDGRSPGAPLRTIQGALNKALPGTTVNLAPGIYRERPVTVRAGIAHAPITVKGPETGKSRAGRYQAVVSGKGNIFNINHSYYTLRGFTIDGQERLEGVTYPTGLSAARPFKEHIQGRVLNTKLIYLASAAGARDVKHVLIDDMFLSGAGGECVRLRNGANRNIIQGSVIQWCGMRAVSARDAYKYHNGEGVYIGTSPKSTDQPMYRSDRSWGNIVRDNIIYTYGAECFDVKENAHHNTFENNDCRYNDEPLSFGGSNIELRGDHNLAKNNLVAESNGWNLSLNTDDPVFDRGGNTVQGNTFYGAAGAHISNGEQGLGRSCGNRFQSWSSMVSGNPMGDPSAPCPAAGRTGGR